MTVIRPQTPGGYTIFCDDVRFEQGTGKQMYIGAYLGQMIIRAPKLPVRLPSFHAVVFYQERKGEESTHPVSVQVFLPGKEEASFRMDIPRSDFENVRIPEGLGSEDQFVQVVVVAAFPNFKIDQAGLIKVRAFRGEDEIRLGTLLVTFIETPAPAASPAPTDATPPSADQKPN
jgi:hypothetical protein